MQMLQFVGCCVSMIWVLQTMCQNFASYGFDLMSTLAYLVFVEIVKYVYLNGPAVLGMWNGKPVSDICAALTNVGAQHWRIYAQECNLLIERHVLAYAIGFYLVVGGWALHMYFSHLWYKHTIWRPVLGWAQAKPKIRLLKPEQTQYEN